MHDEIVKKQKKVLNNLNHKFEAGIIPPKEYIASFMFLLLKADQIKSLTYNQLESKILPLADEYYSSKKELETFKNQLENAKKFLGINIIKDNLQLKLFLEKLDKKIAILNNQQRNPNISLFPKEIVEKMKNETLEKALNEIEMLKFKAIRKELPESNFRLQLEKYAENSNLFEKVLAIIKESFRREFGNNLGEIKFEIIQTPFVFLSDKMQEIFLENYFDCLLKERKEEIVDFGVEEANSTFEEEVDALLETYEKFPTAINFIQEKNEQLKYSFVKDEIENFQDQFSNLNAKLEKNEISESEYRENLEYLSEEYPEQQKMISFYYLDSIRKEFPSLITQKAKIKKYAKKQINKEVRENAIENLISIILSERDNNIVKSGIEMANKKFLNKMKTLTNDFPEKKNDIDLLVKRIVTTSKSINSKNNLRFL